MLFIFTTFCAIPLGWLAVKMRQAERQKAAVDAIVKDGGMAEYDYQRDSKDDSHSTITATEPSWLDRIFAKVVFVQCDGEGLSYINELPDVEELCVRGPNFKDDGLACVRTLTKLRKISLIHADQITDAAFDHLETLPCLRELRVEWTPISDISVERIARLSGLEKLLISSTAVTDVGLGHLKQMQCLRSLQIHNSKQVSGACLEQLRGLSELRELYFGWTPLTDDYLVHLKDLSQLRFLGLTCTSVTDEGLRHLEGLSQIKALNIYNNRFITAQAVNRLKAALPGVQISYAP